MNHLKDLIRLRRLIRVLGVDFHVLNTLILRSCGIIAGGVTIALIPLGLTPVTQGYCCAFASILAPQIFLS